MNECPKCTYVFDKFHIMALKRGKPLSVARVVAPTNIQWNFHEWKALNDCRGNFKYLLHADSFLMTNGLRNASLYF